MAEPPPKSPNCPRKTIETNQQIFSFVLIGVFLHFYSFQCRVTFFFFYFILVLGNGYFILVKDTNIYHVTCDRGHTL